MRSRKKNQTAKPALSAADVLKKRCLAFLGSLDGLNVTFHGVTNMAKKGLKGAQDQLCSGVTHALWSFTPQRPSSSPFLDGSAPRRNGMASAASEKRSAHLHPSFFRQLNWRSSPPLFFKQNVKLINSDAE